MKKIAIVCFAVVALLGLFGHAAYAQVSLTTLGSPYPQNFDSLVNTAGSTTNTTLPSGWALTETGGGTRDNEQYAIDNGNSTTGDVYSYGASAATDRAFGGLQSGTLIPVIGASFTNSTGATITDLAIAYTGEEWRLGTASRTDRMDFQYSTNATSLTTGTWIDVDALDFSTPDIVTAGAKNGNAAAERTAISSTISGLSIANGTTFWIRWNDFNASGADDGLAVDDFFLTPTGSSSTNPSGTGSASPGSVVQGGTTLLAVTVTPGTGPTSTGLTVTGDLSSIGGSLTQSFFDDGTNGDVIGGDNVFSYSATVPGATTTGAKSIPIAIGDAQSRSGSTNISLTVTAPGSGGTVVISQIYGGGGNTGATYQNDYIELFNRGTSTASLTGWSVQYAAATGTSWTNKTDLSGSLAAGQYLLVQEASAAPIGSLLPTPEITGTIAMSATAGKVALVNNNTLLAGSCPTGASIIDFVGYGSTASCFEGSGPTPAPGATNAALRASNGCVDNNDNANDFTAGTPNPRNTASPTQSCTATLGASPASFGFGSVDVGSSSASQAFLISNSGGASSGTLSTSLTGSAPSQFVISSNSCTGSSLGSGGNCSISVQFRPTSTGSKSATLRISATPGGTVDIPLTGTGTDRIVMLSPPSISFPDQRAGTTSAPQPITMTNTGNATLNISGIAVQGSNASDFSETHDCLSTLNSGQSCTINVRFAPTTTGPRTATLVITDDANNSPQLVQMTGTGIAPSVMLQPQNLDCGTQRVGTSAAPLPVTLTNSGTDVLNLTSIAITSGGTDYSQVHNCPPTLNPGQSCTVHVTFTPTALGSRPALLQITDDASDSPQSVPLQGIGVAPALAIDHTTLDFGSVNIGNNTSLPVRLKNVGTDILNISSIAMIAGAADFQRTYDCGPTLNPGDSCTVTVTFAPTLTGVRTGILRITDDASDSPQSVSLSGTGLPPCPAITLSPPTLPDGTVGFAYSQTVTANGGAPPYTVKIVSGSLPAGLSIDSLTGNVSGTPASSGISNFSLRAIDNNGCSGDQSYSLTIVEAVSISGQVFSDHNNDGIKDAGEPRLSGWTIYLDANHNGALDASEDSAVTDAAGNYSFVNLTSASYRVREVGQTGWAQSTTNPSDISTAMSGVDFGNHDIEPPAIPYHWTWEDSSENNRGPFGMQAVVRDNSESGDIKHTSFFDVFFDVSSDGGTNWTPTPMSFNPNFDPSAVDGGGRWWAYSDVPPGGYPVGTTLSSRIRAIDFSNNITTIDCGTIFIIPRSPWINPLPYIAFKTQSEFENGWYGHPSNSWCGPTAASSVLQMIMPQLMLTMTKAELVNELAKQMNTDSIAKNGTPGSGKPGQGSYTGHEQDTTNHREANGIVYGIDKFLRNFGQRDSMAITTYSPNTYINSSIDGSDNVVTSAPTYADYKRELQKGEKIEVIFRYGKVLPNKSNDNQGGHCVASVGYIDGDPPSIVVMDPATGDTVRIRWDGNGFGKYSGQDITIKEMIVISPKGNRAVSGGSGLPVGPVSLGSTVTPGVSVQNTHATEYQENFHITLDIPGLSYSSTKLISSLAPGVTQPVLFDPVTFTTKGTLSAQARIEPGDVDPTDDQTIWTFTVVDSQKYRTGSMLQWALDPDKKGAQKPIKAKPDSVQFKFNLVVRTDSLLLSFPMLTHGKLYGSKLKTAPLQTWTDTKKLSLILTGPVSKGDTIQFDGIGLKGKPISISYSWSSILAGTSKVLAKGSLPKAPLTRGDTIKLNRLLLPMPNLHNIGTELFTFKNAFSAEGGLLIGEVRPESVKTLAWILHKKYRDVQKSLNKKGVTHEHWAPQAFGPPLKGQRNNFPPDRNGNWLFADAVALGLNLAASDFGQMPPGLGNLIINHPNPAGPASWDGFGWVDSVRPCYDNLIAGHTVREFYNALRSWLTNKGRNWNGSAISCDNAEYFPGALLQVAEDINNSFSGPNDTVSWGGVKVQMTGVRSVLDVPFLHDNPNAAVPGALVAEVDPNVTNMPAIWELRQNYPNPFNPATTVSFVIGQPASVTLKVFNVLGQEVATLLKNELMDEGSQEVEFDAHRLASGVYFYHLIAEPVQDEDGALAGQTFTSVKKMMLLR